MKKRSEFRSVVGAACFAMAFGAMMVVALPKAVFARKPELIEVDEAGAGGATLTQGPCTGNNAPSCEGGHTCECVTFSIGVSDAKPKPRRVAIESQGTLGTTLSIDLTDQTDNGAGGLCFPWNGIGTLAIGGSTVTLPEQGRVCQVGSSTTTLSGEGTHDLQSGTEQFQDSQGQGTISFTIRPSTPASTGATALTDVAGLTWDDVFWILCPLCTLCNHVQSVCD